MKTYNEENPYEEKSIDLETGEITTHDKKSTVGASMKFLLNWGEERRGYKVVNAPKQYKAFKRAMQAKITPDRLQARWVEMESDKFWLANGFDWMDVVNSFDKRPWTPH